MNTTITIKTDKKLRDAAKKAALELGIPLSTVMNAQLRQFVETRRFSVSIPYRMSHRLEKTLARVERDLINTPEAFKMSVSKEAFLKELSS